MSNTFAAERDFTHLSPVHRFIREKDKALAHIEYVSRPNAVRHAEDMFFVGDVTVDGVNRSGVYRYLGPDPDTDTGIVGAVDAQLYAHRLAMIDTARKLVREEFADPNDEAPDDEEDLSAWQAAKKRTKDDPRKARIDKWMLPLPAWISEEQQRELLATVLHEITAGGRAIAYACIHRDKPGNPHSHIVFYDRMETRASAERRKAERGGKRARREFVLSLSDTDAHMRLRQRYMEVGNAFLESFDSGHRIEVRRYEDIGIDQEATKHIGSRRKAVVEKQETAAAIDRGEFAHPGQDTYRRLKAQYRRQHSDDDPLVANPVIKRANERKREAEAALTEAAVIRGQAQEDRLARLTADRARAAAEKDAEEAHAAAKDARERAAEQERIANAAVAELERVRRQATDDAGALVRERIELRRKAGEDEQSVRDRETHLDGLQQTVRILCEHVNCEVDDLWERMDYTPAQRAKAMHDRIQTEHRAEMERQVKEAARRYNEMYLKWQHASTEQAAAKRALKVETAKREEAEGAVEKLQRTLQRLLGERSALSSGLTIIANGLDRWEWAKPIVQAIRAILPDDQSKMPADLDDKLEALANVLKTTSNGGTGKAKPVHAESMPPVAERVRRSVPVSGKTRLIHTAGRAIMDAIRPDPEPVDLPEMMRIPMPSASLTRPHSDHGER